MSSPSTSASSSMCASASATHAGSAAANVPLPRTLCPSLGRPSAIASAASHASPFDLESTSASFQRAPVRAHAQSRGSATSAVSFLFSGASAAVSAAARTSRAATDGGRGRRVFMPYRIESCCTMDASTSALAPDPRSAPGSNDAAPAGSVSACLRSQNVATPEG